MKFLLLGYGSIGTRHASILRSLGHEVLTVDPDPARGADYRSPWQGIGIPMFDGLLDCTPPDVRAGWKVPFECRFVEKPLGIIPERRTQTFLGQNGKGVEVDMPDYTMVGFCYHYLPSLARFVSAVKSQPLAHLLIVGGQSLQSWHKQDYRTRKYWGVATDSLPHSLYIARWILGDYALVGSCTGRFSDLEIETEDTAGVLLQSSQGVPCYCEADYLREPRLFYIEAIATDGKRHYWEFDPSEAPEMYLRQMKVFVELCVGEDVGVYPDLQDGIAVQRVLDKVIWKT